MPDILAIIPARGGSKGIPLKNLVEVGGKALLLHSIEQAKTTPAVTRVMVSTDDDEIAAVAQSGGAEVVRRPPEISGDKASSESALLHVLDRLKDTEGYDPDLVVFLQATSPMRAPEDIQHAIETLQQEQADSLFSARHVEGFTWRVTTEELAPLNYDPLHRPMRQELTEHVLEENGSLYIFKPWVLREHNSRLAGKIAVYEMSAVDSLQVDRPEDLEKVEMLMQLRARRSVSSDLANVKLLVVDFDGVLTDNTVQVDQQGIEAVTCHRGDGLGVGMLKRAGLEIVVLSTEKNPVVAARCRKLRLEFVQGCDDKLPALKELVRQRGFTPEEVAFIGNDVNDSQCLAWVGTSIVPADAWPDVRGLARLTTRARGGHGVIREVADLVLAARGCGGGVE